MSKAEPIWVLMKEADDLVAKLISTYPEKFGHVDPEVIGCASITGKDPPESQKWDARIEGIKEPAALWSKKIYCISFYQTTWESYTDVQREFMMFKLLERVPEDCNGKVLPEDLKDSYCLVKAFGPDYMKSTALPSLTKQKQVFGDRNGPDNGV